MFQEMTCNQLHADVSTSVYVLVVLLYFNTHQLNTHQSLYWTSVSTHQGEPPPQGIVTVSVQALSEAVTQAPTKSTIVTPQEV